MSETAMVMSRQLVLPPPYRQVWLPEGEVLAGAASRAAAEGAGTLVWRHAPQAAPGRLDAAVVLEPETPLAEARRVFLAGAIALCDALATHVAPERAIRLAWPGGVLVDTGRLGGLRLVAAPGCAEDAVPDWLVLGFELLADRDHLAEPGLFPGSISLAEEGIEDPGAIVESFAAHLMLNLDRWKHDGFSALAARYSERLVSDATISDAGDLELDDGVRPLARGIEAEAWRGDEGPLV
jgi:biotin-(acetyl-CoA carboxylase) ligase